MEYSFFRFRMPKWAIHLMLISTTLAIVLIGVTRILSLGESSQQTVLAPSPLVGRQALDFTLSTLDGAEVSLSKFHSQPVLINFWASWCLPCREEMPELVRSYEAHKAEGLIILGVNVTYSDTLPDAQAFASEFKITFPVLLDMDGAVAEKMYQIPGIPTSVFVNRDGMIARIQVGVMTGKQIKQYISEILP